MFNIKRLEQARKRLRMTAKELAEKSDLSSITISRICNGKHEPDETTIIKIVNALGFPRSFFEQDIADAITVDAVSFRSLSSMTAKERDAALTAGELAYELADWMDERYDLPKVDIPDLSELNSPKAAARSLRQYWGIGERPIKHLLNLLEAKGTKIFSLNESTKNIDAFSVWRSAQPYIFLNTFKTAERSRFDAAHELGHLVLHRHGGPHQSNAEKEANDFASEFLMPEADVRAHLSHIKSIDRLISEKLRWGVSLAALCYRMHKLDLITDWQYRTYCIQINQRFKFSEPNSIAKEQSSVWNMIFQDLWKSGIDKGKIAKELHIPLEEFENLVFGLTETHAPPPKHAANLVVVK
ncbi:XRE family transcriptional regulator [Bartonella sp. HY329]|uniref:XRE family transcriptional regulator n=1 Tax=unclassified Bartonella TaxID=2645622 RepID=UPI0021CA08FA|nr:MULTISPECIES: XRE family transcriptional regulator [unclassified Bartonella]UXM94291.1 XRE family transcriptional regulator [Bartonella sp. HY329]UXN08614.1 XRE family transcriptional regulator [Bartonella sp. HY328]